MLVGFLRSNPRPGHLARLMAILGKEHGLKLIYFNLKGVNINEGKVTGKTLINNQWVDTEVDIPKFVDINPNLFKRKKYKKQIEYLRDHSHLSVEKRMPLPKDKLQEAFSHDPKVSKYLIPTKNISSFRDIIKFIKEHEEIVLKPVYSNQGKDIYKISKRGLRYAVEFYQEKDILSKRKLRSFYEKNIKSKIFIAQKYIDSKTIQHGHPFDCRIHVEKNGQNKWRNVKNFIRVGIGQSVISNINQGGGIADVNQFLKSNYPDNWEDILGRIKEAAKIIPYKVEEYTNYEYMTMGLDIGIDKDGELYLFEVNDYPILSPLRSEAAMVRIQYYKYKATKG